MSNDYSPRDNWDEPPAGDEYDPEEEAFYPSLADDEAADEWDEGYDDNDRYEGDYEDEALDELEDDVDASLYDDPAPLVTDFDLEQEEENQTASTWLKENWWRLAVVILLLLLILAMLAKACTGKDDDKTATPIIPTKVTLPTLTPTPAAAQPTATPVDSGSQAPAEPTPVPPTPAPQPTTAPAPAPATTGKFSINQTVTVTNTGRDKLSFRAGPGTNYARLRLLKDGTQLIVIGGPEQANGYTWWQLKTPNGDVGWAIQDNLQ